MGDVPNRDRLEAIRDLNKQNMTHQMQLDREKIMVGDLKQLADARSIRQEVLETGKICQYESGIAQPGARRCPQSGHLIGESLVAAREAIRVLQSGGSERTLIPIQSNFFVRNQYWRTGSSLSDFNRNSYLPSVVFSYRIPWVTAHPCCKEKLLSQVLSPPAHQCEYRIQPREFQFAATG